MGKRLGCFHSHHSNIGYIEDGLSEYDIDFIHFVDPGLMNRVTHDQEFREADAEKKVKEQLKWVSQCNVDAILITCTNYIALLKEEEISISVPIIKIDEPYIASICNIEEPQEILFTNPNTVKGTMERLNQYAKMHQKSIDVAVSVINNTFELVMQGKLDEYNQEVAKVLSRILTEDRKVISVAQLSMVQATRIVEKMTSKKIINPLDPLISFLVSQLEIVEQGV